MELVCVSDLAVHQTTRKVIRKYVSADGVERQEVQVEGAEQEAVRVEEGDVFSRVVKRTVVCSQGDHHEVSLFTSGTLFHLHMLVFTTHLMFRTC